MGTSLGCRQAPSASPSWALGGYGGVRRALAPLLPPGGELGSPGGALTASAGHHPDKLWEGTGQDRVGRKEPSGPAQDTASKSPSDLSAPPPLT